MKRWLPLSLLVVLLGLGSWWWQQRALLLQPTAHFASSTPAAGSVLPAAPINVVIDFDLDLGNGSSITIRHQGQDYGKGGSSVDRGGLGLRREVRGDAPDGEYTVSYKACWAKGGCDSGGYKFRIDRSTAGDYTDLRGQSSVTIELSRSQFAPPRILISPGTQVTWVNRDEVEHYINTDAHPSHTYFTTQNSRALAKGASYQTTFRAPGYYPYHCSAHAAVMIGGIIVE